MTDVIPQREALPLYLAMVAGSEHGGFFEIRSKRTTGSGMSQDWIPLHEPDRAARSLVNRGQTSDTYLGVAPRTERKGGLAAVERVWCVWADCDSRESLELLAGFDPLPSIVIRSGSQDHAHAYWPLRRSVPSSWAKRANQRLALRLRADRNATDAAPIMRPPGTFNHKHDPCRPVVCTRLELDVFTIDQVVGGLPDDRSYAAPAKRMPSTTGVVSSGNVLDGLARTVRDAAVDSRNRNSVTYWAACRSREHDLNIDDAREVLREAALSTGLPEDEVDRTLASARARHRFGTCPGCCRAARRGLW